jgi:hypothetical protein
MCRVICTCYQGHERHCAAGRRRASGVSRCIPSATERRVCLLHGARCTPYVLRGTSHAAGCSRYGNRVPPFATRAAATGRALLATAAATRTHGHWLPRVAHGHGGCHWVTRIATVAATGHARPRIARRTIGPMVAEIHACPCARNNGTRPRRRAGAICTCMCFYTYIHIHIHIYMYNCTIDIVHARAHMRACLHSRGIVLPWVLIARACGRCVMDTHDGQRAVGCQS